MPITRVEHYASSYLSMLASYTQSPGHATGVDEAAFASKPAPGARLAWTPAGVDLSAYGLGPNIVATNGYEITGLTPATQYYVRVTPGLLTFKSGEPVLRGAGSAKPAADSFSVTWGASTADSAAMVTVSQVEWDKRAKEEADKAAAAVAAKATAAAEAKAAEEADALKKVEVSSKAATASSHKEEAALLASVKEMSVADRKRMYESRGSVTSTTTGVRRVLVPSSELEGMQKRIDELQTKLVAVAASERAAAAAELEATKQQLAEAKAHNVDVHSEDTHAEATGASAAGEPAAAASASSTPAEPRSDSHAAYTDPGLIGTVFSYVGGFVGMTAAAPAASSATTPPQAAAAAASAAAVEPAAAPAPK